MGEGIGGASGDNKGENDTRNNERIFFHGAWLNVRLFATKIKTCDYVIRRRCFI